MATGWTEAAKGELVQTLLDYWPNQFRGKDGKLRHRTIQSWVDALESYQLHDVTKVLGVIKQDEEKDFAPPIGAVRKALSKATFKPGRTFLPHMYGHSVTINEQTWTAASAGCHGPGGFWVMATVPQNVFDAIVFSAPAKDETRVYPTARDVAANDAMWRGRVDHPDAKLREVYRRMRHAMAHGSMPTVAAPRMREPGED